jgi:hypothetical protein
VSVATQELDKMTDDDEQVVCSLEILSAMRLTPVSAVALVVASMVVSVVVVSSSGGV